MRACKDAGIEGLMFHDLRHTFASRLIKKGVDIETVKSLLGHYSIVVTQRFVHSSEVAKRRAVEQLAQEGGNGDFLFHHGDMEKASQLKRQNPTAVNSLFSRN